MLDCLVWQPNLHETLVIYFYIFILFIVLLYTTNNVVNTTEKAEIRNTG